MALLWNVKLFDRVLVSVTTERTAKALCELLNNGDLYGVPGDAAAYEDARGVRTATVARASVEAASSAKAKIDLSTEASDD